MPPSAFDRGNKLLPKDAPLIQGTPSAPLFALGPQFRPLFESGQNHSDPPGCARISGRRARTLPPPGGGHAAAARWLQISPTTVAGTRIGREVSSLPFRKSIDAKIQGTGTMPK